VPGSSPVKVTLWLVERIVSGGAVEPYASVVPYSTLPVVGSSVPQVMVAPVSVIDEDETLWMLGGVISAVPLDGDDVLPWLTK
jgi:hypothetical protein